MRINETRLKTQPVIIPSRGLNFVLSYFFDQKPVDLLDFIFRKGNKVEQAWSAFMFQAKGIKESQCTS